LASATFLMGRASTARSRARSSSTSSLLTSAGGLRAPRAPVAPCGATSMRAFSPAQRRPDLANGVALPPLKQKGKK